MSLRKRRWLIAISLCFLGGVAAFVITAKRLSARFQPYIREQAIEYLENRFDSDVELTDLRVSVPNTSLFDLVLTRGRGVHARVEGEGIVMRHLGRRDIPPMFAMKRFNFEVDLGTLFDETKVVSLVTLDGMEITIPPKGERPQYQTGGRSKAPDVLIQEVMISDAMLTILPQNKDKTPLQFDIHQLHLQSTGKGKAMKYDAALTNATPPGEILSNGKLGPWTAYEPGDTPLDGDYNFAKADLGVFKGIAGILNSTGSFTGTLDSINARGQASVPDFRLKISGNRVPLLTKFEALIDGTNGNTVLKPVVAKLGTTDFTTSGAIIKHEGNRFRTISLDVFMPKGNMKDLLRLAMKDSPFMEGQIALKTKIDIPPLSGKVREKLRLDGNFEVTGGKFLQSKIQDKLDTLSRRGQGQPKNEAIDEVLSKMKGTFTLEDEVMTFHALSFGVPGADVDLAGNYTFDGPLDFHGTLRLKAKVSQTMTGLKRILLKPVDPFFAKNGAGTFLRIKVEGTAADPQFGRDTTNGKKDDGSKGN
jgi:hypothetical protein